MSLEKACEDVSCTIEEARGFTKTPYIMVISEDEVKLYRKD